MIAENLTRDFFDTFDSSIVFTIALVKNLANYKLHEIRIPHIQQKVSMCIFPIAR